jgi:hypothetical protein
MGLYESLKSQVVRFGGAAGENDLARRSSSKPGDLLTRPFHSLFGFPAKTVASAGRIAKLNSKERKHGLDYPRIHGRSGMAIEIYWPFRQASKPLRRHYGMWRRTARVQGSCRKNVGYR